jgi:hypothetical protein
VPYTESSVVLFCSADAALINHSLTFVTAALRREGFPPANRDTAGSGYGNDR